MALPDRGPLVTRRQLLVAGAGAVLAAACGGGGGGEAATTSSTSSAEGNTLLRFFHSTQPTGRPLRLPFGLADHEGVPLTEAPPELTFTIARENEEPGTPLEVPRHNEGIPRPYYPLTATFEEPGIYDILAEFGADSVRSSVMAAPPEQTPAVPAPGEEMIPVATPTVDEPLGVDPICTREPPCELHDVSLDRALQAGRPVAFLISTPAFCQVQICGPVLDVLLGERARFGDRITMIHNEVYTSRDLKQTTEAVQAYKLPSEPVLFLAGADGVVVERLDNIYDGVELRSGLERLVAS